MSSIKLDSDYRVFHDHRASLGSLEDSIVLTVHVSKDFIKYYTEEFQGDQDKVIQLAKSYVMKMMSRFPTLEADHFRHVFEPGLRDDNNSPDPTLPDRRI